MDGGLTWGFEQDMLGDVQPRNFDSLVYEKVDYEFHQKYQIAANKGFLSNYFASETNVPDNTAHSEACVHVFDFFEFCISLLRNPLDHVRKLPKNITF